jgi:hypothetical protein
MRMKILVGIAALALGAVPLAAHHAFAAEFDVNQPVKVKGTITKVEWVNPHAWLYVDVKGDDGKITNWRFELGAPNAMIRLGWRKESVPAGLEVSITGFRAKSGDNVGNGRSIILPDGRELFSGGSGPGSEGKQ